MSVRAEQETTKKPAIPAASTARSAALRASIKLALERLGVHPGRAADQELLDVRLGLGRDPAEHRRDRSGRRASR